MLRTAQPNFAEQTASTSVRARDDKDLKVAMSRLTAYLHWWYISNARPVLAPLPRPNCPMRHAAMNHTRRASGMARLPVPQPQSQMEVPATPPSSSNQASTLSTVCAWPCRMSSCTCGWAAGSISVSLAPAAWEVYRCRRRQWRSYTCSRALRPLGGCRNQRRWSCAGVTV